MKNTFWIPHKINEKHNNIHHKSMYQQQQTTLIVITKQFSNEPITILPNSYTYNIDYNLQSKLKMNLTSYKRLQANFNHEPNKRL